MSVMNTTVPAESVPQEMLVIQHQVTAFLLDYCHRQQARAERLAPAYGKLWQAMTKTLQAGGKRLRPYLFLLAYDSCNGKDKQQVLPIAAAWELLHVGLLVQDDIIDRDYTRHGQLNMGGMYRATYAKTIKDDAESAHFADSAALLAGDLFLNAVQDIILSSSLPDAQKVSALRHLNKALYEVIGGELLDMEAVMSSLNVVDARSIALLKTAVYSVVGPLVAGADAAGASSDTRHVFDRFGAAVGMGYQLRDDLLGVFGDSKKTGKTTSGDLHEAKRTLLMQETARRLPARQQARLNDLMNDPPIGESDVVWLRKSIVESGAQAAIEQDILSCEQRALHALDDTNLPHAMRQKWLWIVRYSLFRDH